MTELPSTADVVVVGAGIIGLTTALELVQAGLKVCIIDSGEIGRECSWAGGGLLSPLPPNQPVPEIEVLLQQSLKMYPDYCAALAEQTGIDAEYWVCGGRFIGGEGELVFPKMAQVRNPRLLQALHRALTLKGVDLMERTAVHGWQVRGERLVGLETARGSIACDQAVLAAGAWSGQLAPLAIQPAKGQMLLLRGKPGMLDHIRISKSAYLIPRRDGVILVGSTVENAGFDLTPTAEARAKLINHARALWPMSARLAVEGHWAGLRPRGESNAPTIAAAERIHGLFYNTGHFRLGITLAPASARQLAGLMLIK